MSKKVLSLVLALVMVLGSFGTVFAAATTPTGNEKVDKLIELELVKGDANGYRLADNITRAEVATMVVRALDLEAVANASAAFPSQFKDMNSANVLWARGHVNVAAGQGIVNGYPEDGTFKPANNVTYAEAAAMLVRVLNGMTAAEQAKAVWPTTYLAKAAQLGIFADVDGIVDFNAPANRENLFEMVFNTLTAGSDLLVANTIEGIVVENYRTESLNANEIVVHVMKDQDAENNKYDVEEGEEFEVIITAELAEKGIDVETLLGKVVKISYDKNDKVVGVEVNNSYDYLTGTIDDITSKKIVLNEKSYTVEKTESRSAADERLYQVYLNNDDVAYDDLTSLDKDKKVVLEAEYANITVRNGKVLFIDAYQFEDIAPVAEDITEKNVVSYFDDSRDGDLRNLTVKDSAYVINFEDGLMKLGSNKDISANDVIHFFTDADDVLTVIVRPAADNMVEGKYTRATLNKTTAADDLTIKVGDESYPAYVEELKRDPVYSTLASSLEFDTLTLDFANELAPFKDEEVVVLLDMFGNVQLIASETIDASFLAIVQNRLNNEFRLYRQDNESVYYTTTLKDTSFRKSDDGRVKDQQATDFAKFELVQADAKDDLLTSIVELVEDYTATSITRMDSNRINGTYIAKNAVVFTIDGSRIKAYSVAEFLKEFGTKNVITDLVADVEVYVNKDNLANAIIVTGAGDVADAKITAKVTDIIVSGSNYWIELDGVEYSNGKVKPSVKIGDIVKAEVTDEKDILSVAAITMYGPFEVKARLSGRNIQLVDATGKDTKTLWVSNDVTVFGGYSTGDKIMVDTITGDIAVINRVKASSDLAYFGTAPGAEVTGVVTYINQADSKAVSKLTLKGTDSVTLDVMYKNEGAEDIILVKDTVIARVIAKDGGSVVAEGKSAAGSDTVLAAGATTKLGTITVTGLTAGKDYTVKAYIAGKDLSVNLPVEVLDNNARLKTLTILGKAVTMTNTDNTAEAITLNLPFTGTDLTKLVKADVNAVTQLGNTAVVAVTAATANTTTDAATVVVTVTAEDETASKVYTVTVNKLAADTDVTLKTLVVGGIAQTPGNVAITLPAGTTATPVVSATVNGVNATAVITPATDVTANDGIANVTTIVVTAESGATATYKVTFTVSL